jgi:3D (Asp-Asp-Asp) domain-containing protein
MSESEHTPGPWIINDENPRRLKVECSAYEDETPGICGAHSKEWPLTRDDARLISKAPELLMALIKLSNEASGWFGYEPEMRQIAGNTNFAVLKQRVDEARAIIAEAVGS